MSMIGKTLKDGEKKKLATTGEHLIASHDAMIGKTLKDGENKKLATTGRSQVALDKTQLPIPSSCSHCAACLA
jgi:hypothetical protein